jgi:hypothetical protein
MRAEVLLAILALTLAPGLASAQWAEWDYEFDQEKKSWTEMEAKIPAYPATKNLVPLEGGGGRHNVYIDANSISLGEDGVMRYTAVIRTLGGATNVTFEGMRCETREQKTYALGHSGGRWSRARTPEWRRIEIREILPYHYVLYREYFCPSRASPPTPKAVIQALKQSRSFVHGDEGRQRP